MNILKRYMLIICMSLLLLSSGLPSVHASTLPADQLKKIIAFSSDALISSGDQNWEEAKKAIASMKALWETNDETSADAQSLTVALTEAEQALAQVNIDPASAKSAISKLAKAADRYVTAKEDSGQPKEKAHKQIAALLPLLQDSMKAVSAGNGAAAKKAYNSFVTGWYKAENLVRAENVQVYSDMEVKISGARIALNTDPIDPAKGKEKLQDLITIVENYLSGKAVANVAASSASGDQPSISSLLELLDSVEADIQSKQADSVAGKMDTFISSWPSVEGVVMTKSPATYSSIETKMVSVPTLILSSPPNWEKASSYIAEMKSELQPFAVASSYTAWDAGVIMFREGLEAILIIVSLLTFLKKSGNEDKRKWIWSGAMIGIIGSALLAILLSIVFSNLSTGSSRETIEGITGIIAVLFMLTIGAWLHKKSNLQAWNRFVEKTIGTSLAKGTLWSLSFTAFLAVIREGAETIIFYMGMAATIHMTDLIMGIGGALIVLAIIAYVIIKLSNRIPIRPFFLVASLLLYYMAFKFIGASIHSLQVTGSLASHSSDYLLYAPQLGIYASWETTVPQLIVLAVILINFVRNTRKRSIKPLPQIN
ncbi:FTR1 family iron permease [Brevibacillus choshinensis]|uniref:FTR1 family iron permease n=1 Tax=Brevibacillus choshinensis TaxID=54911 RepID=UPI00399CE36A